MFILSDSDAEDGWDSEDEGPSLSRADRKESSSKPTAAGGRRGRSSGEDMMVRERGEDGTSVVDLLDSSMVRNMRVSNGNRGGGSGGNDDDDSDGDDDEEPALGLRDGKFVIPGGSDDDDSDDGGGRRGKRAREKGADSDGDGDSEYNVDTGKDEAGFAHMPGRRARAAADEAGAGTSKGAQGRAVPGGGRGRGGAAGRGDAGGRGGGRGGGADKRQKVRAVRGTATGAEFRSKKAGGDVKRKGATLEPYAYIPLDGRTLTGRKAGNTALKQYDAVVGGGRGAKKGSQQRRRGKP